MTLSQLQMGKMTEMSGILSELNLSIEIAFVFFQHFQYANRTSTYRKLQISKIKVHASVSIVWQQFEQPIFPKLL